MSEVQVLFKKCKDVFGSNRSNSLPAPVVEDEDMEAKDPELSRRTVRRSKSGRVKAKTKTRRMVSTFDFSLYEEDSFDQKQKDVMPEKIDQESMKRRIEKTWPGLEEEEEKQARSSERS